MIRRSLAALVLPALVLGLFAGCSKKEPTDSKLYDTAGPDYTRQLAPGESALRRVDPADWPDLATAWRDRDAFQEAAIDQSLSWFAAPSSHQFFPVESITHERARASLFAFRELLEESSDEATFLAGLRRDFDVYQSVGWNGQGTVLFTGYYAPEFPASTTRSAEFPAPLFRRPADLVTDPVTGEPMGRDAGGGRAEPYPTRAEIERSGMLDGTEIAWVENPLAAYIIHVNGSAKLRLDNGQTMYIGYAGKTDRPYSGLGQAVIDEGLVDKNGLSLAAIEEYYRRDPATIERLILRNESYVFFTEYDGNRWPAGSLGVPVTERTSLATDKKIFPRGGVVLVDTNSIGFSGKQRKFLRFMLDQDTGGAIKAPGRADIFMGMGPSAEILAGGQYAEGRMYYLFLKPEQLAAVGR